MPTLSDILSDSIDGRSRLLRLEEASDLEGTRARIGRSGAWQVFDRREKRRYLRALHFCRYRV